MKFLKLNAFVKYFVSALYKFKRTLVQLKMPGDITDYLGLHSRRVGRYRKIITNYSRENNQSGIYSQLIRSGNTIYRPQPNSIEKGVPSEFASSRVCIHDDFQFLMLQNAFVLSNEGWIFTKERDLLIDSLQKPSFIESKKINRTYLWPAVEKVHGKIILPYLGWAVGNYYHWMLEVLPKLSIFLEPPNLLIKELLEGSKILIPQKTTAWMLHSLEMVGIQNDQIYHPKRKQLYVDDLIYLPKVGSLTNTPYWAIDWLQKAFTPFFLDSTQDSKKRLFVSRCKARTRTIVNEDQVLNLLSKYGFEKVILEEITLENQISLFNKAEIIIGPHGAGFSNVVFSKKLTLIEIFEPSYITPIYFSLCHDCGHDYWFLIGETRDGKNILVDLDKLKQTIDICLGY